MVFTRIKTLLTRKYFFVKLVLSKIPSALKDDYLATNLHLLLFLLNFFFLVADFTTISRSVGAIHMRNIIRPRPENSFNKIPP